MRYSIIKVYDQKEIGAHLQLGKKAELVRADITEKTLPDGVTCTLDEVEKPDGSIDLWLRLFGADVKESGTFGFVVSSPNKEIEPITFVFGVKEASGKES